MVAQISSIYQRNARKNDRVQSDISRSYRGMFYTWYSGEEIYHIFLSILLSIGV